MFFPGPLGESCSSSALELNYINH